MTKNNFKLGDYHFEARLARLNNSQLEVFNHLLSQFLGAHPPLEPGENISTETFGNFILPLIEFGLIEEQIVRLLKLLPKDFSLDHREIYFDFKLNRWIKHIEPPTISESLDEYLHNAESTEKGFAFLKKAWREFKARNDLHE